MVENSSYEMYSRAPHLLKTANRPARRPPHLQIRHGAVDEPGRVPYVGLGDEVVENFGAILWRQTVQRVQGRFLCLSELNPCKNHCKCPKVL